MTRVILSKNWTGKKRRLDVSKRIGQKKAADSLEAKWLKKSKTPSDRSPGA